jgi:hypothetical protein
LPNCCAAHHHRRDKYTARTWGFLRRLNFSIRHSRVVGNPGFLKFSGFLVPQTAGWPDDSLG